MPEGDTTNVATAVVETVADHEAVDPVSLPPLAETVDCDALNALFDRSDATRSDPPRRLTFEYCGHEVVVRRDGSVDLRSADSQLVT